MELTITNLSSGWSGEALLINFISFILVLLHLLSIVFEYPLDRCVVVGDHFGVRMFVFLFITEVLGKLSKKKKET